MRKHIVYKLLLAPIRKRINAMSGVKGIGLYKLSAIFIHPINGEHQINI